MKKRRNGEMEKERNKGRRPDLRRETGGAWPLQTRPVRSRTDVSSERRPHTRPQTWGVGHETWDMGYWTWDIGWGHCTLHIGCRIPLQIACRRGKARGDSQASPSQERTLAPEKRAGQRASKACAVCREKSVGWQTAQTRRTVHVGGCG
eukprot:3319167-Rhodomonas_salina.3